ncbi:MAG TPA: GNAT family N-acetyltransferase [Bacteroidia bacterium]|jgi:ribosomal protein S18 acetylase RimI-like enzyme|nr:GNAT family N-acetyltransferase [Bacteroidia bacterium]
MELDKFVFDSQYTFLKEDKKLQEVFKRTVLKNAEEMYFGDLIGYTRKENWDSNKMEKYIGRLTWLEDKITSTAMFKETVSELNEFDCCYVRLNAEHSFCKYAEKGGLSLLSTKASQHLNLDEHRPLFDKNISYVQYSPEMKNGREITLQILELSKNSFNHGRFRADKNFSKELVDDIYRSWIVNEIKNKISKLYLAIEGDKVASFFLYKENISPIGDYTIGFVSLIASSPEFKGKQYASNLLNYVLHSAKLKGTNYVIANTETGNAEAISFFKKNGFKSEINLNEYHIWN